MNLDEYKEWLKENANIEEQKAYEVANTIIKYHESEYNETKAELFPRETIANEKERLEFDLLIKLTFNGQYRKTERLIGVEFKEYDIKKVIHQAIVRRPYVDYQYIATRFVMLDYTDLFLLSYYSIGWVVWDEDFVKLLIPAKWNRPTMDIYHITKEIVKEAIKEKVKEEMATLDKFIH